MNASERTFMLQFLWITSRCMLQDRNCEIHYTLLYKDMHVWILHCVSNVK